MYAPENGFNFTAVTYRWYSTRLSFLLPPPCLQNAFGAFDHWVALQGTVFLKCVCEIPRQVSVVESLCPRYVSWSGSCAFYARGFWMCSLWVFTMRKLSSSLSLFSRDDWQESASHGSGPSATEAHGEDWDHRVCGLKMLFLGVFDPTDSAAL